MIGLFSNGDVGTEGIKLFLIPWYSRVIPSTASNSDKSLVLYTTRKRAAADNSFVHIAAENLLFFFTASFISIVLLFRGIRGGGGRRLRPPLRRGAAMLNVENDPRIPGARMTAGDFAMSKRWSF